MLAATDRAPALNDIDLADIVRDQLALASSEADARRLRLELDLQPAPFRGERDLLERMVSNLLENAVRHNADDGWFLVKTLKEGDRVILEVANGGPLIPPDEVEHLFERFYRPDRSRSRKTGGFGLGLSIVKVVAEASHGPEGGISTAQARECPEHLPHRP